jgi:hypothetical protein
MSDYELKRSLSDIQSKIASLEHSVMAARRAPATSRQRLFARVVACHVLSKRLARPAAAIAAEDYGNDPGLLRALAAPGMIGKAASGPARTDTAGWAAELATSGTLETLQIIAPNSVYAQLSQRPGAIRVDISGRASIKVPTRTPTPTLSAPFVAEGAPIPVRQLGLSSATIAPRKCAVISQFTEEMLKRSAPSVELVIRAAMEYDTAAAIDGVLLGTAAASAVAPAGILNGVTPTTATAGGGLAAFAGDVRALALAIEASGPLIAPVLIMSSTSALLLGTLTQNVTLPIVASPTVPAKQLIMVDAANFASAEGDQPDISTSSEVTLHQEDTTPLAISTAGAPPTIAAPTASMFQINAVAIRLIQDVTWGMTRAGRVAVVNNVTW